jgi:hypothetical protein
LISVVALLARQGFGRFQTQQIEATKLQRPLQDGALKIVARSRSLPKAKKRMAA